MRVTSPGSGVQVVDGEIDALGVVFGRCVQLRIGAHQRRVQPHTGPDGDGSNEGGEERG
mgnify:CR=1 FL=1